MTDHVDKGENASVDQQRSIGREVPLPLVLLGLPIFPNFGKTLALGQLKDTNIPVSSTFPNSLFTAVPNVFIVGERFIYILMRGGINSPFPLLKF